MKIDYKSFLKKFTKPKKNMFPTGTRVYKGFQGSGKTLSMVKYAFDISKAYPKAFIYSNIRIKGLSNYNYLSNDIELQNALNTRNGDDGVLILLDEAHLFFNKKNGISLDVLTAISQQRKDRKRLVFSSQIWEELDISLRKQVKEIVNCRNFGNIQINTISDGETLSYDKQQGEYIAKKIRTEIYKHYDKLLSSYDTLQKIYTNKQYNRPYTHNNNIVLQQLNKTN